MHPSVYSNSYLINLTLLDLNQQLRFTSLLTILQDMATLHAEELGHGYEQGKTKEEFWVFSQQCVRIFRMPQWHDTVTVETWIGEIGSISAIREFALVVNGERIGECSMQCMLLDQKTHRPKRLKNTSETLHAKQHDLLSFRCEKITVADNLTPEHNYTVAVSDLDLNHHVNNAQYLQWILNILPLWVHKKMRLTRYSVNFLAETFIDDCVIIASDFGGNSFNSNCDTLTVTFTGIRRDDDKCLFSAVCSFESFEQTINS